MRDGRSRKAAGEVGPIRPRQPALGGHHRSRQAGGPLNVEEFFETGREEIRAMLDEVAAFGVELRRGRALDFGCGVGRVTQALAEVFDHVVGVDIAPSMIERARAMDRHPDRVEYRLNASDRLSGLV